MRVKNPVNLLSIAGLALAMLAGSAVAEPAPVGAYEIKLFLTGRTADCVKSSDDSTCDTYFGADGSVKRFTYEDRKLRLGKWWVDEEDHLCVQWEGKDKPLRFDVVDTGEGTWKLVKGGRVKADILGAQPGDTLPAE